MQVDRPLDKVPQGRRTAKLLESCHPAGSFLFGGIIRIGNKVDKKIVLLPSKWSE